MKELNQIKQNENNHDFSRVRYAGNYAIANFLNLYQKKCPILNTADYPKELKDVLSISDPHAFHLKMIEEGYLEPSSVGDRLEDLSTEEIVKIANEIGLPSMGERDALIHRLDLNCELDVLLKYIPNQDIYSLSYEGEKFLNAHTDLIELYNNSSRYGVNYSEYSEQQTKYPEYNFHQNLWAVIRERFNRNAMGGNYSKVQQEYLYMYALFFDEERFSKALESLLSYFYMQINAFTDTLELMTQFKRQDESVSTFMKQTVLPKVTINQDIVNEISQLSSYLTGNMISRICKNEGGFYVKEDAFQTILIDIVNKTFNLEQVELAINTRIPRALDHLLRTMPNAG